jgi:hypothetical protein
MYPALHFRHPAISAAIGMEKKPRLARYLAVNPGQPRIALQVVHAQCGNLAQGNVELVFQEPLSSRRHAALIDSPDRVPLLVLHCVASCSSVPVYCSSSAKKYAVRERAK